MNCKISPDMGTSIYMNSCCCNEIQNSPGSQHANCSPGGMRIGMSYVPMQPWAHPYTPGKGLKAGTIFPCLHLPFAGGVRR